MNTLREIIRSNRAWLCLDCGKCSSVCPITLHLVNGFTNPRLLVETAVGPGEEMLLKEPLLWSCLTCGRCSQICPSGVDFPGFIQQSRQLAREHDLSGECTHSGVIQAWGRMMTDPELKQDRLAWIGDGIRVSEKSDTIYFPGCLPYYQEVFSGLGFDGWEIARAAVKVLNALGIEPQVLADERCCGHDQFWQGDRETFLKLAAINLELFSRSGAKRIVTTCPECAYTLKVIYPQQVGDTGMEILHLAELLAGPSYFESIHTLFSQPGAMVTYQDPCRLGRFSGVYQQPRDLITAAGCQLVEMEHTRQNSLCCGTSCWSSCGQANKQAQVERLQEARATGAETLVTACVKCQIHLKCAQDDPLRAEETSIRIKDLALLLAESLESKGRQ
jgi:heterodisulfide reductase subunit D